MVTFRNGSYFQKKNMEIDQVTNGCDVSDEENKPPKEKSKPDDEEDDGKWGYIRLS
jgi:hypothetical protein